MALWPVAGWPEWVRLPVLLVLPGSGVHVERTEPPAPFKAVRVVCVSARGEGDVGEGQPVRDIGDVGDWELFTEFFRFFRHERAIQLIGWTVLWGVTGRVDDLAGLRRELEARGLSKSAVYRAAADFRRFREHLEALEHRPVSMAYLLRRLAASISATPPIVGNGVI